MPAYKEKTKNTWYVSFYFTDWTGTRKRHLRRGFKRQKDALEYEREFLVKQQGSPDMLFSSLYDLYQKDGKARVKETTITTREPLFKKHILPYLGNMPINKITPADIRAWQNQILQATYITKGYKENIPPHMLRCFMCSFPLFLIMQSPITGSHLIRLSWRAV